MSAPQPRERSRISLGRGGARAGRAREVRAHRAGDRVALGHRLERGDGRGAGRASERDGAEPDGAAPEDRHVRAGSIPPADTNIPL